MDEFLFNLVLPLDMVTESNKYTQMYNLHTYLLTPWSRVLLEKLTGSAASQEIPRIFGTRRFLTVPTIARHLSLSWANSIQSPQLPSTSWRSILILSSHLRLGLPSNLFPSGFPTMFVYIYHSKTNEISFTTHPLDIAYYVLMYHVTLWFLFSFPCQTWWWPYNKRAKTCCLSFDSYILIKFCCVSIYPPYQLRYCNSQTTGMNHLMISFWCWTYIS